MCSGTKLPFDEAASVFLGPPDDAAKRIGSVYTKALYVQYTDDTFTQRVPRAAKDEYLGLLGPTIRANVGDTIKVVFRNNLR
jgi:hephaestin